MSFSFTERDGNNYLLASCSGMDSFPEDAQILIRFFDDSMQQIEGKRLTDNQTQEGSFIFKTNVQNSTAEFLLSKEIIEKLKIGIKKIRISTAPTIFEKDYKKDKLGKRLYEQYQKSIF